MKVQPTLFEECHFKYLAKELNGATPEQIAEYYVLHFVFENEGYLESIKQKFHMPDDILKIHNRICQLAEA